MSEWILIIGGGIAGIQAALDAAEAGAKVLLVEKGPAIGGYMALLDKTFPTLDCSICIEGPKIGEVIRHPNIEVVTLAEVMDLKGEPGNFTVTIYQKPRYVTPDCTKCGNCSDVCPVTVPFEVDGGRGISLRKAIYLSYPQAEPGWYMIDIDACLNDPPGYMPCDRCIRVCERNAIDFSMQPKIIRRKVASVIVATGYDMVDPEVIPRYKYGKIPDVLTSYEFERLLNASGPSGGEVLRPSDGEHVKKLLLVTCVGSRDSRHAEYCSRFCCMYTLKHAIQAKQHGVEDVTALFMDIRTYGKGFEHFYKRALEEGIKIIRGRPSEFRFKDGKIVVRIEDTVNGVIKEEEFDMAVLAPAVIPNNDMDRLSRALGIDLDEYGFIKTASPAEPISTTRPGVYVCGSASGPKDIADTVQEAGAAVVKALTHVGKLKITHKKFKETITDVETPRIGVFVCHCGSNIAGVVDVKKVVEESRKMPGVVYAEDLRFACSAASVEYIAQVIKENNLNRLVVAACSPATHLTVFRTAAEMAGLNPFLVDMANVRNLDSWVHMNEPEAATEKAIDYVRAAVDRSPYLQPLKVIKVPVVKRILVIGGGIAGLSAAAAAAKAGIETVLVEKEDRLGGILNDLYMLAPEDAPAKQVLDKWVEEAKKAGVKIYLNTVVERIEGFAGSFKVTLSNGETLDIGAIILATGVKPHKPVEFGYGNDPRIITLLDVEKLRYEVPGENIVFIGCVGSRNNGRGCSRYCCTSMIHQAIELRKKGKNVAIIYKDIRTYTKEGEKLYKKAGEMGVLFIKVNNLRPMEENVEIVDGSVLAFDELSGERVKIPADAIVLANGLEPNTEADYILEQLKVSKDAEGFLMEAHPKLGPVESLVPGVLIAGSAQSPKNVDETITHALAAASKAVALLSKGYLEKEPMIAVIDQEKCIKCGACMRACPYGAIKGEVRKYIYVIPALCEGCGACVGECPINAITIPGFGDEEIYRMIDAMLASEAEKKPIVFACYWCSYAAADNAGIFKIQYPPSPRVIRVPCSSRINWRLVKKAFLSGAPAVAITGCRITESGSDCHYQYANKHTVRRYKSMKNIIKKLGIREERLILSLFGAPEVDKYTETMKELDRIAKSVSKDEILETISKLKKVK